MADIRISELPLATGPTAPSGTDVVAIDGLTTRRTTITALGDVAAPIASQAEAETGVNAVKRMTPLTTKQSIASEVGDTIASAAQGSLADSALQPSDIGTTAGTIAAGNDSRIVNAVQPLTSFNSRSLIVRGKDLADGLWNSQSPLYTDGKRGPLFIWNNPSPTDFETTGENAGLQIWIGDNPTATPGGGHAVGQTIGVINGNSRNAVYGLNILTGTSSGIPGYVDGFQCGLEINTYGDFAMTQPDPYGGGARKNAVELTTQGSVGRMTTALMVFATDMTGSGWYQNGIALSRCFDQGITFYKDPGGGVDSVNAFQTAAIYDKSASTSVLKVDGVHQNIINLSGITSITEDFVRASNTANTTLKFSNRSAFDLTLDINSAGASGGSKQSVLSFSDNGTTRWRFIKNSGNDFALFNNFLSSSTVFFGINDNSTTFAANVFLSPGASVTPATNGQVTFQLTSNTQLTFKAKGSDGVVRSGSVTLA